MKEQKQSFCRCSRCKKHHCKSHSHILSLSLLLLLAAGDISPNPGPSLISTCFQPRSTPRAENTRKTQNLIPITCHKPSTLPFSCALWNARSICNKLTFTHDLFTTNSLNLLALTETWLSSSDTASPAALSHGGFHLSHTPRPGNKQGGGVGVLLSSRCTFHLIPPVPSLQFSSFEAHTIRLFSPMSLRVAVIYRPPGTSSQFLDHFSAWLPHFLSSNIPTLILGDFNIAIDTPTSSAAAKLLALTSSLGLSQLTDSSTHHAATYLKTIFKINEGTPANIKIFNLSSRPLDETEESILKRRLSFAPDTEPNPFELFIDIHKFIRKITLWRHFGKMSKYHELATDTADIANIEEGDRATLEILEDLISPSQSQELSIHVEPQEGRYDTSIPQKKKKE
ncbi:uncharacterized protein O3C94_007112 [Discoglossus pictus]